MIKKIIPKNFIILGLAGILSLALCPVSEGAEETDSHKTTEHKNVVATNVPVKLRSKPSIRLVNPVLQRGEILSQVKDDIDGDGKDEIVMLMGNSAVNKSSYMGDLYVVSKDPATDKVKGFIRPKDLGGYNAYLSLTDVTGNDVQNILITAPSGGKEGVNDYRILDFSDKNPREIFTKDDNRGVSMQGIFLPDFKARLYFPSISKEVIVDLTDKKETYEHLNVYNKDGSLKDSGIEPFILGLGSLVTLDLNEDGIDDVITTQKVVGTTNDDVLGYVRAVWEYRAGTWQQKKVSFQTNLYSKKTYNTNLPVKGMSGYEITSQSAQLDNNIVIYPRFVKIVGPEQWKINSQLENFAKNVLDEVRKGGQVELNYEIKYAGNKYASVLFKGTVVKENHSAPVLEAYNFNLATGEDMPLDKMVRPFGEFWNQVKNMLSRENIAFTKDDIYGYYYDGNVLALLYNDGKEFDVEPKVYSTYLSKNKLQEKIVTDQSIKEKESKKEKKAENEK
ncbi:MAG: hypothetical protein LKJ99_02745 [Acidaminococcaceae bacterium]|jgi:hypothetical protein|nr:hypothetical protein [Acidaminococcaceae bacterium]MCI2109876.1 hypothetical protein [Acidaminococcaceae bacterium]